MAYSTSSTVEPKDRLQALRRLLDAGTLSTQDELREKLEKQTFKVTQSTISRDLRKLGAVKAIDPDGRTVYRLGDEVLAPVPAVAGSIAALVVEIATNGSIIVVHTTPGSASLVARHLDHYRPGGILGTLAGDDTIFVAPASLKNLKATIREIQISFESRN
jgi:transcriptional regulator of arginine metabolism